MPLSSVLEMMQTKKYYQHQLVKGGQVFSQFNHGAKKLAIVKDLPGSVMQDEEVQNQEAPDEERMEIDQVPDSTKTTEIVM